MLISQVLQSVRRRIRDATSLLQYYNRGRVAKRVSVYETTTELAVWVHDARTRYLGMYYYEKALRGDAAHR